MSNNSNKSAQQILNLKNSLNNFQNTLINSPNYSNIFENYNQNQINSLISPITHKNILKNK